MRKSSVFLAAIVAAGLMFGGSAPASAMVASFYDCFQPGQCSRSKVTASGEKFNWRGMTAAHKTLPIGTRLRVCYRGCVVVRINDRGPFVRGRDLDLSRGAAHAIGMHGVANVQAQVVGGRYSQR